jgi:hypothetical protein
VTDRSNRRNRINDYLVVALALIADLPLTKDETAEAVRRLLRSEE